MTAFPALRSFLDCSTAHLSPAARDHLDMVAASRSEMVAATPYGWFLWAGQDGVDDRMPDTLTAILAYARTIAPDYVLFEDRKSVVWGKSVSVSVDQGGSRILTKKNQKKTK